MYTISLNHAYQPVKKNFHTLKRHSLNHDQNKSQSILLHLLKLFQNCLNIDISHSLKYPQTMEEKIACCGIDCLGCEAFKATASNDDNLRDEVAAKWRQAYSPEIKASDINCTGCLSDGTVFSFCQSCKLRTCCKDKNLSNCAKCDDYPCQTIEEYRKFNPDGISKLDSIRIGSV